MKIGPTLSLVLMIFALVVLAACGGQQSEERPAPTEAVATAAPRSATASTVSASLNLIDSELIGAAGVTTLCEAADGANLTCQSVQDHPALRVTVDAGTFARWTLRWDDAASSLTGNETLRLQTERNGNLTPNLYLVERNGHRVPVNLGQYGLKEGVSDVRVPLQEVVGEDGYRPDFSAVNEVQIVFEWADMAGELALQSLRFDSVWEEPTAIGSESLAMAEALTVPTGFLIEPLAENLREMTQIDFTPQGDMLVSMQNGRVWWYEDANDDRVFDRRRLYAAGFEELVGLLYDPVDGGIWLGGRGKLYRTLDGDGDGVADVRELRIDGLPWGRHQNNGLAWHPDPDPFTAEAAHSWIYFGLGSTEDLEIGGELNATVLRFPRDGADQEDLEVVSRGNRNAYMVAWANLSVDPQAPDGERSWQLFASENGPDFNDAPDEVNHIRWQHHYGFPDQYGAVAEGEVDGEPFSGPVYPAAPHASASGLAYIDNPQWPPEYRALYVTLFGQVFSPDIVGHTVERIQLTAEETTTGLTYRGIPSDFVAGLDRPLPLMREPDGNLVVGDYATGLIYEVSYAGE